MNAVEIRATIIITTSRCEEDFEGSGETYEEFLSGLTLQVAREMLFDDASDMWDDYRDDALDQIGKVDSRIEIVHGMIGDDYHFVEGKVKNVKAK